MADMRAPIRQSCSAYTQSGRSAGLSALLALSLCGCSTQGGGSIDRALEVVGLKTPPVIQQLPKELPAQPRRLPLRLHAGEQLNTDATGRSLAVVARIYKLRAIDAFMQAPYDGIASQNAAQRSDAWNRDVVEMREVVMAPGHRHEVVETIGADTSHIAVVALFRSPAEQRWRFVFDARRASADGAAGITVGLHACAMSVAEGPVVEAALETQRLAGVRCN